MSTPRGHTPFGGSAAEPAKPFGGGGLGQRDVLRRARALAVLLLLVVAALLVRETWRTQRKGEQSIIVELAGDVAHPGLHHVAPGSSARQALELAGGDLSRTEDPFLDLPLQHGYRVELLADGAVRIWLSGERLLVGLPVDPNTADTVLLQQLPGIGPSKAEAIIAARDSSGPFETVDDLLRVRGIGPATLAEVRPYLGIVGLPEPEALGVSHELVPGPALVELPLDLNRATLGQLEALPGVDADMAVAIVEERSVNGPFSSLEDLARVPGAGTALVGRLAPFVAVGTRSKE